MLAKHALYQLSYGPHHQEAGPPGALSVGAFVDLTSVRPRCHTGSVVGPGRLELPTSRLSGVCSNQLSYRPLKRSAPALALPLENGAPDARSHCSLTMAAAAFEERETETAAIRTCLVCLWRINRLRERPGDPSLERR